MGPLFAIATLFANTQACGGKLVSFPGTPSTIVSVQFTKVLNAISARFTLEVPDKGESGMPSMIESAARAPFPVSPAK